MQNKIILRVHKAMNDCVTKNHISQLLPKFVAKSKENEKRNGQNRKKN